MSDENMNAEQVSVFEFATLNEKVNGVVRIMERIEATLIAQQATRDEQARMLAVHAWIWKIVGTVMVLSFGMVLSMGAWAYNQLQDFKKHDNDLERRILILEYQAKGPAALNDMLKDDRG